LTCLGLDIVRHRERKAARAALGLVGPTGELPAKGEGLETGGEEADGAVAFTEAPALSTGLPLPGDELKEEIPPSPYAGRTILNFWHSFKFYIGLVTTALVFIAWTTNLVAKPLATEFGGTVVAVGMVVAYFSYARHKRDEQLPVVITHGEEYLPGSTLAVLAQGSRLNEAIVQSAINEAEGRTVVFLYLGTGHGARTPNVLEFHDPYYDDEEAKKTFGRAEYLAREARVKRVFLYRQLEPHAVEHVRSIVHPYDTIIAAGDAQQIQWINADRVRYEVTPEGKIAHLLKRLYA
jgi:hypothetical protein